MVEAVSGAQEVLAHGGLPGPPRVGRYGVDLAAFERVALPALPIPRTGGVVVVDELGKMELASAAFGEAVVELLERDVAVVATIHLARHQLSSPMRSGAALTSGWSGSPKRPATPCRASSWNAWSAQPEGRRSDGKAEPGVHVPVEAPGAAPWELVGGQAATARIGVCVHVASPGRGVAPGPASRIR